MSKPTLCVIVPVYKAAATLDRCVASVLAQQVAGGLHCILVDDGSPDESGGLCDAWAARDPRVTVLHQENRGVSAARNAGLATATASTLSFSTQMTRCAPALCRRRLTPKTLHRRTLCSGTTPLTS